MSVILPIYNASKYIDQCLESIIYQSIKDIEIICVNDGSTDNTLQILQKYADLDNRIVIVNQENQGAGSARNLGAKIAKGKYLSFSRCRLDFLNLQCFEKAYETCEKIQSRYNCL